MNILITGASGRLGSQLMQMLGGHGHSLIGVDRIASTQVTVCDLTDYHATRSLIHDRQPDLIIHAAAWTDVDGCAREPERAVLVNGLATQNVAVAAAQRGAAVMYISTNEVFDGESRQPYREYDPTRPINPYGYSKWVGERAVQTLSPRHFIVRTSWMFAHGGTNFVHSILNAARAGSGLRVVVNEVACPTFSSDLAEALVQVIDSERYGIYHLVNEGAVSRCDFARRVLDRTGFAHVPITRIHSREWPRPSTPPAYSPLANTAGRSIGITLRRWEDALDAFLKHEGLFRQADADSQTSSG